MNPQNILVFVFTLASLVSCRKDDAVPVDFREKYLGNYEFNVIHTHWMLGTPGYTEENIFVGQVFIYDSTASYSNVLNTNYIFNSREETLHGLTIYFSDYCYSHCYLEVDDTIRHEGGYHYSHDGYFTTDSIFFNVIGLGGLGGGDNYYTKGRKL